jgi:uncharacterized protein (UPF0179 family)
MADPKSKAGGIFGLVVLVGAVLCCCGSEFMQHGINEQTRTCTVKEKDRGADDGSYRVYTTDCGVLANSDSLLFNGKSNSADIQGSLEPGHTYKITTVGVRWSVASWFPNIIEATEVNR